MNCLTRAQQAFRHRLSVLYWIHIRRDAHRRVLHRWFREGEPGGLRFEYPLGPSSIVLDLGGYVGDWTDEIRRRYDPYVYVFEPVPDNVQVLHERFGSSPKVRVFPYGLADRNDAIEMAVLADRSGAFTRSTTKIRVSLRDAAEVLAENGLDRVDLMKVNIEGGEFDLLERLLATGTIARFDHLLIQFHRFVPNAEERRRQIRDQLSRTHELDFDYPFVWESWHRHA